MKRKAVFRNLVIGGAAVVSLAGIGGAAVWRSQLHQSATSATDEATHNETSEATETRGTVPVRVFVIGSGSQAETATTLTGTVQARYEHASAFRVAGKVLKRHVEVGQTVRAGQVLYELDPEDYLLQRKSSAANLDVAKASLTLAIAEERRSADLRRSGAVSASEYERTVSERDVAIGRVEAAQKQLELSENQLTYCRLTTDVDGTVTSVNVEAGQVVNTGTPVCSIAQSGELEAVVDIPENRLQELKGAVAEVSFWSLPGVKVVAQLRELSPTADQLTRTYRGRFTLIEAPTDVKLGMTATVTWRLNSAASKFTIPAAAVFKRDNQPAVWRVDVAAGTIAAVPVVLEQVRDGSVVVSGAIQAGDTIVSAGVQKLDAGLRVRIWEAQR